MAVINQAEAQQELGMSPPEWARHMNGGRRIPHTLARIRKLQQDETFPICNVGPWDHRLERGSLFVLVPGYDAAKDKEKLGYAASDPLPAIRREAKIVDENEFTFFEDDGHMVALDLIGVGFGLRAESSLLQYGVFVPAGAEPTEQEITQAKRQLRAYGERLITEARSAYDKGPQEREKVISDRHLWAARQVGINEAWVHQEHTQQSVKCEMCGKFNPSGIAKCACGNIIDFDLFKRLDAKQKQQMAELEEATKPGKK